jgi:hypothetical protein
MWSLEIVWIDANRHFLNMFGGGRTESIFWTRYFELYITCSWRIGVCILKYFLHGWRQPVSPWLAHCKLESIFPWVWFWGNPFTKSTKRRNWIKVTIE